MDFFNALTMIGGLALFLYGMNIMGDGLSKMAGGKLESILERLTSKRIFAVLLGTGVTAVIQSSSATTVMVVGFVNSGIMKLSQAAGIIMGANIGTTVTSWLLSLTALTGSSFIMKMLKPSSFAPILAGIGIVQIMMKKGESKRKDIGHILIGFAILMSGMQTMTSAVSGLAHNETFVNLMVAFRNPIIGMIIGAVLTAIIQSSSASVGILQALCATGAVPFAVALPIIMGQNIGTCVTSIISSVGASKNAKRAAMVHLYFNLLGTTIFMGVFYLINTIAPFSFLNNPANAAGIAIVHSLFNIGATVLFFPFSNQLVRLAEITIRDNQHDKELEVKKASITIDERFLDRPAFAMELCRDKAREMAKLVEEGISLALEALKNYDAEKIKRVIELEGDADHYEDILGSYLVKLSGKNLSVEDSQTMSIILHSISDFERISDHALDVAMASKEIHDKNLEFTDQAKQEISVLCQAVKDVCEKTVQGFCNKELETQMHVEPLEQAIDTLIKEIKKNHIERLQKGKCSIEMGFILGDILTGLERVSDHCSNIAVEMITICDNRYNTHEYFNNFSERERKDFATEYDSLLRKYQIS